ncbi:hypothetical protein PSPO01_15029 [Paraphaeosphaeria sporulosa]
MTSPVYTWAAVEQFEWCFVEVDVGILSIEKPRPPKNTYGHNTIEKGSERSKVKDIYEMTVVEDDVSSEKTVQPPNANDDEARLWTGPHSGVRASASSNLSKPAASHVQAPTLGRDSEGRKMYVTSETTVEYGDR